MNRVRAWLQQLTMTDRVVVGFAVLLVVMITVSSGEEPATDPARGFDVGAAALLAGSAVLLAAARRYPGTIALLIIGLAMVWYSVGYASGLINVPVLVACYLVGATGDRRRQLGVGALLVGIPAVAIAAISSSPLSEAVDAAGWPVIAILFGEIVRHRRGLLHELARRATEAEADRDAEAERRVAEERLRIARDVHDVLAHTVSVMTVQAGAAADTVDRAPEDTRRSLATIRSAGKQAMAEIKATVAVLRRGEPAGDAATSPAPQLDRLDELVDAARAGGLDVDLATDLPRGGALEALVELTAYRIVQESLTNVTRHSDASRAQVRIAHHPDELVVEVRDNGSTPDAAPPSPGFGLRGMRERVEPLGGTLRYGPAPAGGWTVVATLPTRRDRS